MEIYYENSNGRQVHLDREPYWVTADTDLFDHAWATSDSNGYKSFGGYRKPSDRSIKVVIRGTDGADALQKYKELLDVLEVDTEGGNPGKLYAGCCYLPCWISAGKYPNEYVNNRTVIYTLTVSPYEGAWYYVSKTDFRADGGGETYFLDFPYDFSFDYSSGSHSETVTNGTVTGAEFRLIIYGACTNPSIIIGSMVYTVNCELDSGEYLVIDSIVKKVYKVKNTGETVNQYHLKEQGRYIFQKIPSGQNVVSWSGEFDFSIEIYEKRSIPKWS